MDSNDAVLPQAISQRILIYQNKQLSRLVRDLRWRLKSGEASSAAQLSSEAATLNQRVSELENERRALHARIDRLRNTAADRTTAMSDVTMPSPDPSTPDTDRQISADRSQPDMEEIETLRSEIIRLKSALALACGTPASKEVASDLELFNINSDRNIWMSKARKVENQFSDIWNKVQSRLEALNQSTALTEQTYLSEVEKMSEELVQRQQEIRKLHLTITDLEQKLKLQSEFGNGTNLSRRDHAEESDGLKRITEQLRVKEEQCTRLLAQHVQLQHRLTSLEQEIGVLRSQMRASESLNSTFDTQLVSLREKDESSLKLLESLRSECRRELELRSALEQDFSDARREFTMKETLNTEMRSAWERLQSDLNDSMKVNSDLKKQKLDLSLAKQTVVPTSLLQMELDEVKERVKCPLCQSRYKTVALVTCMHCFCRECVDEKMLNARNRKCPLCMQRFADADVKKLV